MRFWRKREATWTELAPSKLSVTLTLLNGSQITYETFGFDPLLINGRYFIPPALGRPHSTEVPLSSVLYVEYEPVRAESVTPAEQPPEETA